MASISLPALQIRANAESPLDTIGKIQGLRALQQQQQMQQLQQQKEQIALADQQASTKAMKEWDGKDISELPPLILKNGGSANAVFGAKQTITKLNQEAATADEATLKNQATKNDLIAGHLEAVKTAPVEQKQQAYSAAIQDLTQKGFIKPGQLPDQYPGDDQLAQAEKTFMGQKTIVDQEQKKRQANIEQQKADQEAWKPEAGTGRLVNVNTGQVMSPDGQMTSQMADNKYRSIQQAMQLKQPISPDDAAFAKAYEKQKTLVPVANFNLQNGGAAGAPGKPSAIAQGLADGSIKWNDVVSARTPLSIKQQLLSETKAIKPDFNSGDFSIEQSVKKEFTSGDAAKNLTAFNTAIEHAQQLQKAAEAMDNGNVVGLNKIGNALGYQFGSDKTTNFNVIKNALTGEISKVFKGGGATDAEIEAVQGPFSAANSPAQLKGAINNAVALMNSKRDALKQQYEEGSKGKPNFGGGGAQGGGQSSQGAPNPPAGATHVGVGSVDKKKHYLDASGKDLGLAE